MEKHLIFLICRKKASSNFTYIWYIPPVLFLTAISKALHVYEGICLQYIVLGPFKRILITFSALSTVFQLNGTSTGHVHVMIRGGEGYAVVLTVTNHYVLSLSKTLYRVHSCLLAFNNNDNTVLQQENLHRCFGPIKGSNQPAELHMTLITQDKPVQSYYTISVANDQGAKIHRLICAFILHSFYSLLYIGFRCFTNCKQYRKEFY